MSDRAYGSIRSIVERLGGSMVYQREGYRYGAWVIRVGEHSVTIEAGGNRSFPQLDRLYVPRVSDPMHWDDYSDELVPDAETQLLSILVISNNRSERLTPEDMQGHAQLIERARWKFAWTYARTYPHEYTTKALCNPEDHARLIACIERYGIISVSVSPAASISTSKTASTGTWVNHSPKIRRCGQTSSTAHG